VALVLVVQRCTALKLVEHNYSSAAQLPEVSGSRSRRSAGKYAAGAEEEEAVAVGAKSAIKYLYSMQYIPLPSPYIYIYTHIYIYATANNKSWLRKINALVASLKFFEFV